MMCSYGGAGALGTGSGTLGSEGESFLTGGGGGDKCGGGGDAGADSISVDAISAGNEKHTLPPKKGHSLGDYVTGFRDCWRKTTVIVSCLDSHRPTRTHT